MDRPGNLKPAQRCTRCGAAFECGMGGPEPCWCSAEFPAVMPLPQDGQGCYCRRCLAELVAGRGPAAPTSRP